jgi:hypothetical protein
MPQIRSAAISVAPAFDQPGLANQRPARFLPIGPELQAGPLKPGESGRAFGSAREQWIHPFPAS